MAERIIENLFFTRLKRSPSFCPKHWPLQDRRAICSRGGRQKSKRGRCLMAPMLKKVWKRNWPPSRWPSIMSNGLSTLCFSSAPQFGAKATRVASLTLKTAAKWVFAQFWLFVLIVAHFPECDLSANARCAESLAHLPQGRRLLGGLLLQCQAGYLWVGVLPGILQRLQHC